MADLQQVLGIQFKNPSLLEQALTHSSFVNEQQGTSSNERLEFLGDAILDLIIAEKLFHDLPDHAEGEMTQIRAILVSSGTLCQLAKSINLGSYLYLGKGEEASGGREKRTNLESAMEAVIAAVYLDRGLPETADLVYRLFGTEIEKTINRGTVNDHKSRLQEVLQRKYHRGPRYLIVDTEGPVHDRRFKVVASLDDKILGTGTGSSRREAEMEAARQALDNMDQLS